MPYIDYNAINAREMREPGCIVDDFYAGSPTQQSKAAKDNDWEAPPCSGDLSSLSWLHVQWRFSHRLMFSIDIKKYCIAWKSFQIWKYFPNIFWKADGWKEEDVSSCSEFKQSHAYYSQENQNVKVNNNNSWHEGSKHFVINQVNFFLWDDHWNYFSIKLLKPTRFK